MTSCVIQRYFNPRSPHGERRTHSSSAVASRRHFNPRSPHGERRQEGGLQRAHMEISTHAPRTGSDAYIQRPARFRCISTHAPRTGSDMVVIYNGERVKISTHAPRTGSDFIILCNVDQLFDISTHAPRTGSDVLHIAFLVLVPVTFQPTLPARGATLTCSTRSIPLPYFNPRSPHGERLIDAINNRERLHFNPRSPHGERQASNGLFVASTLFQPTLPARGATKTIGYPPPRFLDFNPRSPHGERPIQLRKNTLAAIISTHAPRTGSDIPLP